MANQVLDLGLPTQTAEPACAILGVAQTDVAADLGEPSGLRRGCFEFEDTEACEAAGIGGA